MKVLVACEESQAVCKAFRERGHEAYSCDIIDCSGGHPEWHIKNDVLPLLGGNCEFMSEDGQAHTINGRWDMIIAFPPCTYLTVTGNRWFNVDRYGEKAIQRQKDREDAIEFFMALANADCPLIAIENPIGVMSRHFRKPDQIIHPYYFAESEDDENCERKATCLWLKGIEPLQYEIKFAPRVIAYKNGKGTDSPWHINTMSLPAKERAKARSKTFPGIARAMAEQWG
jgi:site-specific DNA-cytosine methylase